MIEVVLEDGSRAAAPPVHQETGEATFRALYQRTSTDTSQAEAMLEVREGLPAEDRERDGRDPVGMLEFEWSMDGQEKRPKSLMQRWRTTGVRPMGLLGSRVGRHAEVRVLASPLQL